MLFKGGPIGPLSNKVKAAPRANAVYVRREAARELLASNLAYTGDEAKSPVVQYDRSRVDIPRAGAAVPRIETAIDPVGRAYLLHFETRMLRSADGRVPSEARGRLHHLRGRPGVRGHGVLLSILRTR